MKDNKLKSDLEYYSTIKKQLKSLKDEEMELRKELVDRLGAIYKDKNKIEEKIVKGKFELQFEFAEVKFELCTTQKLDNEQLDEDWDELTIAEQICIKKKNSYSIDKKRFDATMKQLLNAEEEKRFTFRVEQYITEKEAAPKLTVIFDGDCDLDEDDDE